MPAKDNFDNTHHFSAKFTKGCDRNTAFHILPNFSKTKTLESFIVIFVKSSPKGFF